MGPIKTSPIFYTLYVLVTCKFESGLFNIFKAATIKKKVFFIISLWILAVRPVPLIVFDAFLA